MSFYILEAGLEIDNDRLGREEGWSRLDKVRGLGKMLSRAVEIFQSGYKDDELFGGYSELGFIDWADFYHTFNKSIADYTGQEEEPSDDFKERFGSENNEESRRRLYEWTQDTMDGIMKVSKDLERVAWMPEKVSVEQKHRLIDFCCELSRNLLGHNSSGINFLAA